MHRKETISEELKGTISERIKYLKKIKDVTLHDMAQAAGVTEAAVHNWISGTKIPRMPNLRRLANFFNLTIDYFIVEKKNSDIYQELFTKPDYSEILQQLVQLDSEASNGEKKAKLKELESYLNYLCNRKTD